MAKAGMKIEPYHLNAAKTVHGGAIFTLADFAFAVASNSHGMLAMGINTSLFRKGGHRWDSLRSGQEQTRNPKLAS